MPQEALPVRAGSLVVYASRKRLGIVFAAALAFAAAGIGGFWIEPYPVAIFTAVLSEGLAAFGCYGLLREWRRGNLPLIIFDDEGMTYRIGGRVNVMAWSDFGGAQLIRIRRQEFVCLFPADIDAALAAASDGERRAMQMNLAFAGAPFVLPTISTLGARALLETVMIRYRLALDHVASAPLGGKPEN